MNASRHALRALVLLPLMLGLQTGQAQTKAAAPVVTSTLDVCEGAATGLWRYSGVISVLGNAGADTTGLGVSYRVQNAASKAGYVDALRLPKVPGMEQGV